MNKVILIGRLTRDPELRYTGNNTAVTSFTVAVNRPFTGQDGSTQADFINVVVWRKQAESVKNYLTQGSQVAVEGRMQTRTYDGEDGKRRYVTEVIAENVQFLDSRKSREGQSSAPHENMNNQDNSKTPYDFPDQIPETDVSNDPFANFGANIEISDEELPF